MRNAAVLLMALALTLVPAGVAGAQSTQQAEPEVTASDSKATIEYERDSDGTPVSVRLTFDTNDTAFATNLQVGNGTDERANELGAQLHQIAEYEDHDEDGRYDADEPIVSSYRLSEGAEGVLDGPENGTVQWEDLKVEDTTSDDGQSGKVIRGQANFVGDSDPIGELEQTLGQAENSTFGVSLYVFDRPATVNGTQVDPGQVKVDLVTDNYPYAKNGTKLVLGLDAASEQGLSNASEPDRGVVASDDIEGIEADLLYTWQQTAQVDDTDQPVGTTRLDGNATDEDGGNETESSDTSRTFALSYERGERVVHDPKTGIRLAGTGQMLDDARDQVSETPGWGMIPVSVILGSVALALTRRRR